MAATGVAGRRLRASGARVPRWPASWRGQQRIAHPRQPPRHGVRQRCHWRQQGRQPRSAGHRRAVAEQAAITAFFQRVPVGRRAAPVIGQTVGCTAQRAQARHAPCRGKQLRNHRTDDRQPQGRHGQPGGEASVGTCRRHQKPGCNRCGKHPSAPGGWPGTNRLKVCTYIAPRACAADKAWTWVQSIAKVTVPTAKSCHPPGRDGCCG